MPRSVEAVISENGEVRLLEPVSVPAARRALVTILDEPPSDPSTREHSGSDPMSWTALYEPVRVLASGGMGRVHLARNRETAALVCVKELLADVDRAALQQECRALARLRHPSVVRLINFEARGERPYLVMEFAPGRPLSRTLAAGVLAQEPLAAVVAGQLFAAVASAHSEAVIHRDLKPENVLAEEFEGVLRVKILDFGLAIVDSRDHRDAITGAGLVAGTVAYMAPEQLGGRAVSGACDVYAVGQMCWEMLSARPAFVGGLSAIFTRKLQVDGLALDSTPLAAGDAFRDLVYACTRQNPADRLSAVAAADAVAAIVPPVPRQVNLIPRNLGFIEQTDQRPTGWFDGFGYVDGVSMAYACRVIGEGEPPERRTLVRFEHHDAHADAFGVLMQRVPARHLAGTTVRLRAALRTDGVEGGAGLWLRADGERATLAFDNMHQRWLRGANGWTPLEITLALPEATTWLNFGLVQNGGGTTDMQNVALAAAGTDGAWVPLAL
jgi:hypothetical protein